MKSFDECFDDFVESSGINMWQDFSEVISGGIEESPPPLVHENRSSESSESDTSAGGSTAATTPVIDLTSPEGERLPSPSEGAWELLPGLLGNELPGDIDEQIATILPQCMEDGPSQDIVPPINMVTPKDRPRIAGSAPPACISTGTSSRRDDTVATKASGSRGPSPTESAPEVLSGRVKKPRRQRKKKQWPTPYPWIDPSKITGPIRIPSGEEQEKMKKSAQATPQVTQQAAPRVNSPWHVQQVHFSQAIQQPVLLQPPIQPPVPPQPAISFGQPSMPQAPAYFSRNAAPPFMFDPVKPQSAPWADFAGTPFQTAVNNQMAFNRVPMTQMGVPETKQPPAKKFTFIETIVPEDFVANPNNHGRWAIDSAGKRHYLNAPGAQK
ncbi:hypothetical protein ASPWEDRAFT_218889 [Aspergillus wentii DTO 134E9]|uniref:Uncharacterized protein n=1 Tax=Aspergillus wentii DTO 134E9 TaxID=1073089 RepID=A0A1L9S035_ASPWE|nr:uncharacterized protein ASPWEDRAFT_218889 [Aspergillus wentii DTO 134E9]OJJ40514.1 hypothetical protein ASPWEDRAFT_218889 [Aspergillus wentii DTO 134E9]